MKIIMLNGNYQGRGQQLRHKTRLNINLWLWLSVTYFLVAAAEGSCDWEWQRIRQFIVDNSTFKSPNFFESAQFVAAANAALFKIQEPRSTSLKDAL